MKPLPPDLHQIRLGDYWHHNLIFKALCPKCGSERQVPPAHVLKLLGQEWRYNESRLPELASHLRCGTCNNKQGISVRLVRE